MIHGFNGGIGKSKNRVYLLLFLLISCNNHKGNINTITAKDCKFQFYSYATNIKKIEEYKLEISDKDGYTIAKYLNKETDDTILYELNRREKKLVIKSGENEADYFDFISEKILNDNIVIQCFGLHDKTETLGPNMFIFWNNDIGIVLENITGFSRELISSGNDSTSLMNLVNQIRADSAFYNNGRKKILFPPEK